MKFLMIVFIVFTACGVAYPEDATIAEDDDGLIVNKLPQQSKTEVDSGMREAIAKGEAERIERLKTLENLAATESAELRAADEILEIKSLKGNYFPTLFLKDGAIGVFRNCSGAFEKGKEKYKFQNFRPTTVKIVSIIGDKEMLVLFKGSMVWVRGYTTKGFQPNTESVLDSLFRCIGTKDMGSGIPIPYVECIGAK